MNKVKLLTLTTLITLSSLQAASARPVMIGTESADLDACLSLGKVTGLNPKGDNYLAVRSEPSSKGTIKDKIHTDQQVYICETTESGWYGVVYTKKDTYCDVTSPVPSPEAYSGPCYSGWIFAKYVDIIAG